MKAMNQNRREMLKQALLGSSWLSLRSLATGLPVWMLADPLRADAMDAPPMRSLILNTSADGDPINVNSPGTYGQGFEGAVHPQDPRMAETALTLAGTRSRAAKPWADLPQEILDRTAFIHHGTYTNTHTSHGNVLRLMGASRRNEMVVSSFSKRISAGLGTTQVEPVSLSGTVLSFEGRSLSRVPPRALRSVLGSSGGGLRNLRDLRDADIDRVYRLYRDHGVARHRFLLDRFAQTREEARGISENLLDRLETIDGNTTEDQIQAAAILAAMNIAPVLTIEVSFGGDNHNDRGLTDEVEETITGVAHFQTMVETLESLKAEGVLRHEVLFGSLNVFGRTFGPRVQGEGRDHNSRHHTTVLIGNGIRGGVYGGVMREEADWGATGMDSTSGASAPEGGDIPYEETFPAVAKTIGRVMGISEDELDEDVIGGKVISAAVD